MSAGASTAELVAQAADLQNKLADLQHTAAVSDAVAAIASTHKLRDEKAARVILGEMVRGNKVPASVHAANFLANHPDQATDYRLTDDGKLARAAELKKLGIL